MKVVKWVDKDGYKRQSLLRDKDPESMAPQGIPVEPPDLDQVDWEEAKKLLWNALVDNGMFEWNDVVQKPNGISNACKTALKRLVTNLYKDRR
jgi:hypothetical protein